MISCSDMHQSFTDTLEKWFFDNFPMFPIVLMVFLFTALPVDQVQAFCTSAPPHEVVPCDSRAFLCLF